MAAFAKGVYDAAAYSSIRPTYPRRLFDTLWAYHAAPAGRGRPASHWHRAIDLGCGTGQATLVIAQRFTETIGVDPSPTMVSRATEQLKAHSNVRYHHGPAEELSFLEDRSVDFVAAAQSVHWFDHAKVWKSLGRVVRPGGTVAFWGYSELRIKHFPTLTPIITHYSQGSDPSRFIAGDTLPPEPDSLAAYWEQPGRAILDSGLVTLPPPPPHEFGPADSNVVAFVGGYREDVVRAYEETGRRVEKEECVLSKEMDWESLESYCRTWSALSDYLEKHPHPHLHPPDAKPDIVRRFLSRLREEMQRATGSIPNTFTVEWPMILLLFRKRI